MKAMKTVAKWMAAGAVISGVAVTRAADVTLTANDATGTTSFGAAGNWNPAAAPGAGNNYFTGAFELWTPEATSANQVFGGDALTISAGGKLIFAGDGAATLPTVTINNWTNSGGLVSARGSANVDFVSALRIAAASTLGSGTLSTSQFSGVISGAGGLTIGTGTGSPLVILTNKNTFTGGIVVSAGATLRADGNTPAGSNPDVNPLGANTITLQNGSRLDIRDDGNGTGTTQLNYLNQLVVAGNATLDVARRTAGLARRIQLGNIEIGNHTLTLMSSLGGNWFGQTGTTTLTGDATINNSIHAFMGTFTDGAGSFSLTKGGSGTMWFGSTTSDIEGGIVVNTGAIEGNADGNVFGTGDITVNAGGTVRLRYANVAQPNDIAYDGNATLALFYNDNLTFNVKSLALNSGIFTLDRTGTGALHTLNTPITTSVNVQFNVTGATGHAAIGGAAASVTLGGNITFNPTTANLAINADIDETGGARSLSKIGAGILTLAGDNTYSGGTALSVGTLRVGSNTALGTGTLTMSGGTLSSDGAIARTLANAVNFTGNSALGDAVNNGKLTIQGNVHLGGVTRTLTVASEVELQGVVSVGNLLKDGPGTLVMTTPGTYSTTIITNGTLKVSGADNILPQTQILYMDNTEGIARLQLTGNSNTVNYLRPRNAGIKILFDESAEAGDLRVTTRFDIAGGTRTIVDHVNIYQGAADYNGLYISSVRLIPRNCFAWHYQTTICQ